jgi:uncharacterized protein (TIGR02145 family)
MKNIRNIFISLMAIGILAGCTLVTPSNTEPKSIVFKGVTYGTVVSPFTNRIWLDRNLEASQVCKSANDKKCFGAYYQWGRLTSKDFIVSRRSPYDWTDSDPDGSKRVKLLMKVDGTGICPLGFRLPTVYEFFKEARDLKKENNVMKNFLKIPYAGYHFKKNNELYLVEEAAYFWTTEGEGSTAERVGLYANSKPIIGGTAGDFRADANSIRCIKEYK